MSARPDLRAPKDDGAILAEPPLESAAALIARNRAILHADGVDREAVGAVARSVSGREVVQRTRGFFHSGSWNEFRREARQAALAEARAYTGNEVPPPTAADADTILVAGHQPELFHPGVWAKNFALAGLARRHGAVALNLVVDNDTVKSVSLRVPSTATTAVPWPHAVTVPFDRWTGEIPYEERPILDRQEFADFAERTAQVLAGWKYAPLLTTFWPEVLRQAQRTPLLGECFAAARRTLERKWGCHNLEIPVSRLCRTEPFQRFVRHILADLPRFLAIYNDCVHEYRRRYDIHSRNHPVPDLAVDGDWLETPFWGWKSGQKRRGRLFARISADVIELRAGEELWPSLPADHHIRAGDLRDGLEEQGYKIRSRALSNTLFARLFMGDLFIHGIGGGKYDELTDAIIRKFYGIEPPAFVVLTATRLLPLPHFAANPALRRQLKRELRDIHWNPQRHFRGGAADLQKLVGEKKHWIENRPADKVERRQRFRRLRELTDRLRLPLADAEIRLQEELRTAERQIEANEVLLRRDYSFVLYPEATLRVFCEQFL